MKDILVLNKQVGETPLRCLERFRAAYPEYANVKMTYAGRLDPMASGLLLVLAGEKVHDKEKFLKVSKTYICTAIVGVGTDTYDILGLPVAGSLPPLGEGLGVRVEGDQRLLEFVGTFTQPYPPYSSKTVNGKQLHTHAREGSLEDVEIPSQKITVSSIEVLSQETVLIKDLVPKILERTSKVSGDFRQSEISKAWEALAEQNPEKTLELVTFSIDVSGGTYIRGVVDEWGRKLGTKACIFSLERTRVGPYGLLDIYT